MITIIVGQVTHLCECVSQERIRDAIACVLMIQPNPVVVMRAFEQP